MAKWYNMIGFGIPKEEPNGSGIWITEERERRYYGDLLENTYNRNVNSEGVNDDIQISNRISILADPFAIQNFASIKYAYFMGVKWKVTEVQVAFPRIILSLGGVYNG